jgi:hypothetical protein
LDAFRQLARRQRSSPSRRGARAACRRWLAPPMRAVRSPRLPLVPGRVTTRHRRQWRCPGRASERPDRAAPRPPTWRRCRGGCSRKALPKWLPLTWLTILLRSTQTRELSAARDATLSLPVLLLLMRWPFAPAKPATPLLPTSLVRSGRAATAEAGRRWNWTAQCGPSPAGSSPARLAARVPPRPA